MKYVILFMLVGLLLTACRPEPMDDTKTIYRIYNLSNHNTQLSLFNALLPLSGVKQDTTFNFINNKLEIIIINRNESILLFSDSAYITFDDSLRITYRKFDSKPRNILHVNEQGYSGYSGGKKSDDMYEYNYYITEDDYKNAVKIQ